MVEFGKRATTNYQTDSISKKYFELATFKLITKLST